MKHRILPLAVAATTGLAHAQLTLVWSDEFNGTTLDTSNWEAQIGTGTAYGLPAGWGNNELQYYTSRTSNVTVTNGELHIIARQEPFAGSQYTSARLRTRGRADFLYGRIEARMMLPEGSGLWPAFWMLPTNSPYGGWAASGEIDIMESVNIADRLYGTIHHGGPWPTNTALGTSILPGFNMAQSFNTYAVEWDPDQIRWYLNGQIYQTLHRGQWFSSNAPDNDAAPFDSPFHLLLNVAIGGNFPGNPNGTATFPQTMRVDWVRVYEFEQVAYPSGVPHAIPGVVEAEHFDTGYGGIAYSEFDGSNNGGAFRASAVDIEPRAGGGHNVGWIRDGEWLEYTVDVQQPGTYELRATVASPAGGGSMRIAMDGVDVTGAMVVPTTGGWQSWQVITTQAQLGAGEQVMRVRMSVPGEGFNLDRLQFVLIQAACPADLTTTGSSNGTPDGAVDVSDYSYYLSLWAAADAAADLTTTGSSNGIPDGVVDVSDFSLYLTLWAAGCP